jgi:hypothetical protein
MDGSSSEADPAPLACPELDQDGPIHPASNDIHSFFSSISPLAVMGLPCLGPVPFEPDPVSRLM